MLEVERKFRVHADRIAALLKQLTVLSPMPKKLHQVDVIFLFEMNSFKNFKRGDSVMRIRSSNNETLLTYKRAINEQGDRVEHELVIDSPEIAEKLLHELGYQKTVRVEKNRQEFTFDGVHILFDQVKDLGTFLEIEMLCQNETEIPKAEEKIFSIAAQLGVSRTDIELKKYDELMSEREN